MTTFAEDAASAQSSRPIEYFDIVLSTGVAYHIAAGNRDLLVGNVLYKAEPAARTEQAIATVGEGTAFSVTLSLPVDHAVVARWFQMGSPPRQTSIVCWQKQERSSLSERIWGGLVTSIGIDGNVAKLLIPARAPDTAQRTLPTITVSKICGHVLFDTMCDANRDEHMVSTTALLVDGRDVRVDLDDPAKVGQAPGWALGGEIVHVPTGERMTVAAQVDTDPLHQTITTLSMQLPIPELKVGDALLVYAGCQHDIVTCHVKFNRKDNYGGCPQLTSTNPFKPTGLGVVEEA